MKIRLLYLISALIIFAMISPSVLAQEYYKWIDEFGDTHYGEEVPEDALEQQALSFPDEYTTNDPKADYYSIQNQLERLQSRRDQQRNQRAARSALQAESRAVNQEPIIIEDRSTFFPSFGFNNQPFVDKKKYDHQVNRKINNSERNRVRTRAGRQLDNRRNNNISRRSGNAASYVEPRAQSGGIVSRR